MSCFVFVDLAQHRTAVAATYDGGWGEGSANAWGNSFPAEELPFDQVVEVEGVPFRLPVKDALGDHVEAVGQRLDTACDEVVALALLCFGEMGEQDLLLTLLGGGRRRLETWVRAPHWLLDQHDLPRGYTCSHLHYPDGYECAALRPVLSLQKVQLGSPGPVRGIQLGENPLFHLMACTLVLAEGPS